LVKTYTGNKRKQLHHSVIMLARNAFCTLNWKNSHRMGSAEHEYMLTSTSKQAKQAQGKNSFKGYTRL